MDDSSPKFLGRNVSNDAPYGWREAPHGARARTEHLEALASLPPVDASVFDDLRDGLHWNRERLHSICTTFVNSVENTLRLLEGDAGPDPRSLPRHLHSLRGSAGMIGARQVEFLAGEIRRVLENMGAQDVPAMTGLLRQALQCFEREIEVRLGAVAPWDQASR